MKTLKHLLLALALTASALAAPIQLIFTGQGSGTLDGNAFANVNFTITGWGDTANRQDNGGAFWIDHDSASIDLGGTVYGITSGTRTFYNYDSNTPGFSRAGTSGNDLYNGPFNPPELLNWAMLTPVGPALGDMYLFQWTGAWYLPDVETTGGVLVFNDGASRGSFEAKMGVPDTGLTLALVGSALLGLATLRRRLAA